MEKTIKIDPSWFKHWFDSSFYHKLYADRDENEAAEFIDALIDELAPSASSVMLDLGCGAGRHARYLAAKGFQVTGIDLAYSSIREARKSQRIGTSEKLQFYRHDMRRPFGKEQFDYVFNFFTSFGYFNKQEEHQQVVGNIVSALKPGGVALIDYLNPVYVSNNLIPAETKEIDGIIYDITRWEDDRHFFKKVSISDMSMENGTPYHFTEKVAKFSLSDFNQLYDRHGLRLRYVFGDYKLNEYDRERSPRLIMIAGKI